MSSSQCCVCHRNVEHGHTNYRGQFFCWPCADGNPYQRTYGNAGFISSVVADLQLLGRVARKTGRQLLTNIREEEEARRGQP